MLAKVLGFLFVVGMLAWLIYDPAGLGQVIGGIGRGIGTAARNLDGKG